MTDTSDLIAIGRFSSLTRISVRMLRHYDAHGVLVPAHVDETTGYRYYSSAQIGEALTVRTLRDVGFGVPAIGALIAARATSTYSDALAQQRAVLVDEVRAAKHRLDLIDQMRHAHHQEQNMDITIERSAFPARRVVALRGTIPTYTDEAQLWDRFMPEIGRQQLPVGPMCGAIDLDQEYQEQDVHKEVFMELSAPAEAQAPLEGRDLPERAAVRATLVGPYSLLGEACDRLVRWAAANGTPGTDGVRYVYLNDVRSTPPQELRTEIYLPVD